jgi:S1-C subfamily serine protease
MDNVDLVVLRGAKEVRLSVKTVEVKADYDLVSSTADPSKNVVPELGIIGVEIDARIAASATGLRDPFGVIVVARAAGAAGDVPLQPKDIIRSVNNRRIDSLDTLRLAVRTMKPGSPVALQIQREGRLMYVSFTFE